MSVVYRFGDFRLDCGSYELLRADRPVKLERKPMELLFLLTSRQGQLVTRSEIAERLWSNQIYVDTEHGINTAIRKLRLTLRDNPAKPKFIKTVTGVGYCFVAAVVTELSPGLSGAESAPCPAILPPTPIPPSATEPRSHRLLWSIAAAAVLVVASPLLPKLRHTSAPVIKSLAVLPLDNFSGDPGQEYLADGMTDELITMIARNSTLRIPSRTSVMQYKGVHLPLSEIARALGVDGIVEGSIAQKGGLIHLTLQLIRTDTDSHVWAQSFDRNTSDTALAEEAAHQIAKQLRSGKPVAANQRPINPAAHDAYLRGKYLWLSDKRLESGRYFQKATEIQPDYAAAWAGLANYYGQAVAFDVLDPRTAFPREEEATKRALELGPDLAEAHVALAATYLIARWDWANADIESQRAISLDPRDGELYYFRGCVLDAMNRKPDAIEAAKKTVELAPFERPGALAGMYSYARQYDAALSEARLRLEAVPNNPDLLFNLADIWRRKGNYKQAVDAWERWFIAVGDPSSARHARQAYERGGTRGFVHWQLSQRETKAKTGYVSPVELSNYHAQLGEREPTLALLEEGYRQRATDMLWIQQDPAYDFLEENPQFRSILKRIGQPAPN